MTCRHCQFRVCLGASEHACWQYTGAIRELELSSLVEQVRFIEFRINIEGISQEAYFTYIPRHCIEPCKGIIDIRALLST